MTRNCEQRKNFSAKCERKTAFSSREAANTFVFVMYGESRVKRRVADRFNVTLSSINRALRRGSQALLDICPTHTKFSFFRFNWNKRTTSKPSPQFWDGCSGKLLYRLLSNQNCRVFWLNGKHP